VPVASRILLEMGKKTRTGGPGHGLVDSVQASDDLRQWNFYVTPRGQKLLDRCFALMNQRKP
jgi:DNA-binding MarR family transcriptional regulator